MLDSNLDITPLSPVELALGGSAGALRAAPVEELADRVSRAAAHHGLLAALVSFDRERYVARRLLASPELEVLLCCWLPGQGTPVHDHAASRAVAAVVFGELVETTFRAAGERAVPERELAIAAHATAIAQPFGIHALGNRGSRPAVSLHVHVPAGRLRTWRVR